MQRPFLLLLLFFCIGCQTAVSPPSSPPTPLPIATFQPIVPTVIPPTPTPSPTEWQPLFSGIERRQLPITDAAGATVERLTIMRIDPQAYRFEIAYAPDAPQTTETWREALGALMVINGGFFTPEYVATGLIVIDGVASGQSYGDGAGMVIINQGQLAIQDLAERPYSPTDPIQFGLQAFPMLVKQGGVVGYQAQGETARRTVVGQDKNGRILFIFAPLGGFSLAEMSQWLVDSDLELDIALNLDGGTSSSIAIANETGILGFALLPTVIAVYER